MLKPIASLIRSPSLDASTARGDWTGSSTSARFQAAKLRDHQKAQKPQFGRCIRRA
jgi:hypothetical protein